MLTHSSCKYPFWKAWTGNPDCSLGSNLSSPTERLLESSIIYDSEDVYHVYDTMLQARLCMGRFNWVTILKDKNVLKHGKMLLKFQRFGLFTLLSPTMMLKPNHSGHSWQVKQPPCIPRQVQNKTQQLIHVGSFVIKHSSVLADGTHRMTAKSWYAVQCWVYCDMRKRKCFNPKGHLEA